MTIKCGREIFELVKGDKIMDNGACYQLTSRKIMKGFHNITPRVSKVEFKKFISLPGISSKKMTSSYGTTWIEWVFNG
jgi:hypothetical protein